jgi:hypothetical protein
MAGKANPAAAGFVFDHSGFMGVAVAAAKMELPSRGEKPWRSADHEETLL